jgi:uncharacterized protein DUF4175
MTSSATAAVLGRLVRPLRGLVGLAGAGFCLGGLLGVLGLTAWSARLGWYQEPSWVLTAWAAGAGAAITVLVLSVRRLRLVTPRWLGSWLEARGRRRGSLTAHLDEAAQNTSGELAALADARSSSWLSETGHADMAPLRWRFLKQVYGGGGAVLAGLVLLWTAGPTRTPVSLLWTPGRAWLALVSPVRLSVSEPEIDRGGSVTARAEVIGHRQAILWTRAPGETWKGQGLRLDSLGSAAVRLGPLGADLFLRVTSGGRSSDTLQVRVRIPAFLGSVAVTARYPRYLHLEDEPVSTQGDTIFLPEGTRLETHGEATAELASASWSAPGTDAALEVSGSRFSGSLLPSGSHIYTLALATASGQGLASDPIRIPIIVVPDSAPRVEVPVPGVDTVAPLSLRVPLVVDAADDHGVHEVVVESRRISRLGFADPVEFDAIPLPQGEQQRAILTDELDLNRRGLLPGDTIRYSVRVTDNAPAAHSARSREFVLRLLTMSEVRAATMQASAAVAGRLDSIAQASRKIERQTDDLSQERPRQSNDQPGNTDESLSFESAKRAEAVAASQQELERQVEEAKRALEALQKSAEAAGLNDPAWQQQLEEIRQELDRALTPELREHLAELQKALKDLDQERTQEALQDLAQAQQQLREALERSAELFRRAALEGDLANLTAEAKDLTQAQKQWTDQVPATDSARAAAEEKALAARTDSLASGLSKVGDQLAPEGRQDALQQAGKQAASAAQHMAQASQSAAKGQRQEAQRHGEQASQDLEPLGDQLQEQRKDLAQQWQAEVAEALDRSLAENSNLAQRELGVSQALARGEASPDVRAEQGALQEGVDRLQQQLRAISGKNALVSQQAGAALSAARDQMQRAGDALASAAPNTRESAQRAGDAVDALNAASYSLLRSKDAVQGAGSGSGLAEAMEQMSAMAAQQGQLSQQAGGMLPTPGGAGALQEQIRALGARQRALAEQLQRMQAGGNMPGSGEMSDEAKDLAKRLEAGRLDRQTVERQERLFRRMLDAGRTLQGHEEDENKERQSQTANDDTVHLPPALRSLLQGNDLALRVPSWEALQALTPDERRLVVEYFRRLSDGGAAADSSSSGGR